jgi:hypothetical protein
MSQGYRCVISTRLLLVRTDDYRSSFQVSGTSARRAGAAGELTPNCHPEPDVR